MNRPAKVILPFFLAAASSLAMAEDGGELTMQRLESASVTNPTAVSGAECNAVIE
ncbi:co-regulatory protein PtrA N-terminal domain-containing protein, partial [Stutzerimonas balearica]|uniref:co-regulatory protein PtrA N-terminal domain-containing protein n=1 Tax=Stutzerimonas balearica TaxID=74829 RepID=UPI002F2676E1